MVVVRVKVKGICLFLLGVSLLKVGIKLLVLRRRIASFRILCFWVSFYFISSFKLNEFVNFVILFVGLDMNLAAIVIV